MATVPATVFGGARGGGKSWSAALRGQLQLALRDAGLPETPESLMALETIALNARLVLPGAKPTPKQFRKAARLYRKMRENPRRFAPASALPYHQAKAYLMRQHKLTTEAEWQAWRRRMAPVFAEQLQREEAIRHG